MALGSFLTSAWKRLSGARDDAPPPRPLAFCRDVMRRRGSSFRAAFLLLPSEQRSALEVVYEFFRVADDLVDRHVTPDRTALEAWRTEQHKALGSGPGIAQPQTELGRKLKQVARRYPLRLPDFEQVLDGIASDIVCPRYETFDDLRHYCEQVAGAVGLACLPIFGFAYGPSPQSSPKANSEANPSDAVMNETVERLPAGDDNYELVRSYALDLGTALQLTNILRDLGEDARRGHMYLPLEDLRRFGVKESDFMTDVPSPGMRALVQFEVERARALFVSARCRLSHEARERLLAVEVMADLYEALLSDIEREGGRLQGRPLRVRRRVKIASLVSYLLERRRDRTGSTPPGA